MRPNWVSGTFPRNCSAGVALRLYTFFQGARAQRQSQHPVPFFKVNGRALRFERRKIDQWLQDQANSAPTLKPIKAKRGRPRKTQVA